MSSAERRVSRPMCWRRPRGLLSMSGKSSSATRLGRSASGAVAPIRTPVSAQRCRCRPERGTVRMTGRTRSRGGGGGYASSYDGDDPFADIDGGGAADGAWTGDEQAAADDAFEADGLDGDGGGGWAGRFLAGCS